MAADIVGGQGCVMSCALFCLFCFVLLVGGAINSFVVWPPTARQMIRCLQTTQVCSKAVHDLALKIQEGFGRGWSVFWPYHCQPDSGPYISRFVVLNICERDV